MLPFVVAMALFSTARWTCEKKRQEEELRMAAKQPHSKMRLALPQLFKMVWFISVVVYEWQTLFSMPWLPRYLGGKEDGSHWEQGPDDELSYFYEIQLAYHAHSMLFAFIVGAKMEMHIHHVVTIILIYLSNMYGFRRTGAIVFTLHDTPDIVGCAIKAAVIAEDVGMILSSYVALLATWGYFRLYLLPMMIIDIIHSNLSLATRIVFPTLLSILVLLHYFWYFQFLLMGYKFRKTGKKPRDISEKVEHPADRTAKMEAELSKRQ